MAAVVVPRGAAVAAARQSAPAAAAEAAAEAVADEAAAVAAAGGESSRGAVQQMRNVMSKAGQEFLRQVARGRAVVIAALALIASSAAAHAQLVFDSPEKAAEALVAAARTGELSGLLQVLGPAARGILKSGDPVADKNNRDEFVAGYDAKHQITPDGADRSILVIGDKDWPLPIPLVKDKDKWRFDSVAGREEVLYRRVGENEDDAIEVALAYVDAQREYAAADPEGKGTHAYAQRIVSHPGTKDGLYWPSEAGGIESPIGEAVAAAASQGYRPGSGEPFHGYYYKVLTGQGPAAKGGEQDYIVKGKMIGGFGLVAYPARYGNSGVMTFIVNYEGTVFQKDLGPSTPYLAPRISRFNPDEGWVAAQPDPDVTGSN